MDKHLPDNIDNFFADNLKNYIEEPGKQSWAEIDRRLSEIEKNKKSWPVLTILSAAAIIAVCLLLPFSSLNPYLHKQQSLQTKSAGKKFIENNPTNNNTLSNTSVNKKNESNNNTQKTKTII